MVPKSMDKVSKDHIKVQLKIQSYSWKFETFFSFKFNIYNKIPRKKNLKLRKSLSQKKILISSGCR